MLDAELIAQKLNLELICRYETTVNTIGGAPSVWLLKNETFQADSMDYQPNSNYGQWDNQGFLSV